MSFRMYLSPSKVGFDQSKTKKKKKLKKAFQKKGERKDKGKAFFKKNILKSV